MPKKKKEKSIEWVYCGTCNNQMLGKNIKRHCNKAHPNELIFVTCPICGERHESSDIWQHMITAHVQEFNKLNELKLMRQKKKEENKRLRKEKEKQTLIRMNQLSVRANNGDKAAKEELLMLITKDQLAAKLARKHKPKERKQKGLSTNSIFNSKFKGGWSIQGGSPGLGKNK